MDGLTSFYLVTFLSGAGFTLFSWLLGPALSLVWALPGGLVAG